jgi:hypothetical protein
LAANCGAWRIVSGIGRVVFSTAHGDIETEEAMSPIRTVLRLVLVVGVAIAGVQALATLLVDPAEAACRTRDCVERQQSHARAWWYHRRGPSPGGPQTAKHKGHPYQYNPDAMPVSPHGPSQRPPNPTLASPNAIPVSPSGPAISNSPGASQFSPYGPSRGSGGGQYSPASLQGPNTAPADGRGLQDLSVRRVPSGGSNPASANLPPPNPSSTSPNAANSNSASPNQNPELTAVTVCMTQKGSCPMQRDVGTPCQCKDAQGHVYDGVVR